MSIKKSSPKFYTEFLNGIKVKFEKLKSTTKTYFKSPIDIVSLELGDKAAEYKYTPRVFFLSMVALFLVTRKIINYILDKIPGKSEEFNRSECLQVFDIKLFKFYPDQQERLMWTDFICSIREWVSEDDLRINTSIVLLIMFIGLFLVLFTWPLFGKTIKPGTLARNTLCSYAIGMLGIVVYTILIGVVQLFSSFKEYGALDMTIFFLLLSGLPLFFHIRIIKMKRGKLSFGKGVLTVLFYVAANFVGCIVCMRLLMELVPFFNKWLEF